MKELSVSWLQVTLSPFDDDSLPKKIFFISIFMWLDRLESEWAREKLETSCTTFPNEIERQCDSIQANYHQLFFYFFIHKFSFYSSSRYEKFRWISRPHRRNLTQCNRCVLESFGKFSKGESNSIYEKLKNFWMKNTPNRRRHFAS